MNQALKETPPSRLALDVETARELMTPNPVSIEEDATVKEAVAFLIDKGFSAAPVIDQAGRPIGVLSRSDILVHDREQVQYLERSPEYYQKSDLAIDSGETLAWGVQVERVDYARAGDIMTPVVFSVTPEASARQVVEQLVELRVHRLFVVDQVGVLVGVISVLDVLQHLCGGANRPHHG